MLNPQIKAGKGNQGQGALHRDSGAPFGASSFKSLL
jgi:hypothetical protein